MIKCKFCDYSGKNKIAIAKHQIHCKLNPDRIPAPRPHKLEQLVKCQFCTDLYDNHCSLKNHELRCPENTNRVLTVLSKEARKSISDKSKLIPWTEERRQRHSIIMKSLLEKKLLEKK
jgi:hypothetical protein